MDEDSGTNLVARVTSILLAVADYGRSGARLIDLARDTGVARPTVHRILGDLAHERFIMQYPDKRYALGPAAFSLSLSAPFPLVDLDAIGAIAQSLADSTTMTCYVGVLLRRRVLYVARKQGSSPVHIYSVEVGETRPLTTTHAGVALLSTMDRGEQEALLSPEALDRTRRQYDIPLTLDAPSIRENIEQVHTHGYLYTHDMTSPGVAGMAAPVPVSSGKPYVAITIAAINSHLPPEAAMSIAPALLKAARAIGTLLDQEP